MRRYPFESCARRPGVTGETLSPARAARKRFPITGNVVVGPNHPNHRGAVIGTPMLATLQSPEHLALVIGTVLLLLLPSLPYDPSLVNHAQTRSHSDADADLRSYSDSPILRSLTLRPAPTHSHSDSHILSHNHTKRTDSHHQTVQTIYSHPYAHSQVHSYSDSTALRLTNAHTHTHSTKKKDSLTHRLRLSHIRAHSKHATRAHQAAGREDGRCFTCPLAARLRGRLEQNASCGTPDATPFRGPCPLRRRRQMTSALTLGHARKCAAHVGISPSTHD